MQIREAEDGDWTQLWSIIEPVIRAADTYTWDPNGDETSSRDWWMQVGGSGQTFVAVDDDGLVLGTAKCGPNQGGGGSHVGTGSFMVGAAHGGRGVGRALAEHVIASLTAEGFRSIQFNAVVETNVWAVALWQSLGFEIVGTIPEAFAHPTEGYVGLHVMWRSLV